MILDQKNNLITIHKWDDIQREPAEDDIDQISYQAKERTEKMSHASYIPQELLASQRV